MDDARGPYLIVSFGGRTAALRSEQAAEVLPIARLDRPAGAPRVLSGFMALDGAPLAVIDLATLFGEAPDEAVEPIYRHVVRLAPGEARSSLGLLVDRVLAADHMADEIEPLEADQSVNGVFHGAIRVDAALTPLIDVPRLLLAEEAARVDELARAAQARLDGLDPAGA